MHIFPQLRKIEEKYANELVVIGVHSAKFPNEKEKENLYKAVQRNELQHPVVNDADFKVWQAFSCRAWPTFMFIDPEGKVIGKHEGEVTFEFLDDLMENMVAEFDAQGLLRRDSLGITAEVGSAATLSFPGKVLADGPGDRLFIADTNHNRILVTSLEGVVQQVIGSGQAGLDDGGFAAATFNHPQGMARLGEVLYVADAENHALRKVDLAAGTVETIAGNGQQGRAREGRGPGLQMELNSPWDLALHQNTLYIAMAGAHQLWSMTLADGQVGPYAGSGGESITNGPLASATLAQPSGITCGGDNGGNNGGGKLYFVDSETSSVRSADLDPAGRVGTLVGLDLFVFGDVDGSEHNVRLQHPIGITFEDGVIYIADTYNHKIKQILPITRSALTVLGTGEAGHNDGPGKQALFSEPSGLSFGGGKLFIADTNNHLIRVADLAADQVWTLEISGL
ncbi:MAG: alkyl hydroperoxide reductase [Chloroflexi bacterium]|nr:alkyl hydroperoxide reductase [Chloroflexota bacterium]